MTIRQRDKLKSQLIVYVLLGDVDLIFGGFSDLPGKSSNPINNHSRDHDVWFDVPRSSRNSL